MSDLRHIGDALDAVAVVANFQVANSGNVFGIGVDPRGERALESISTEHRPRSYMQQGVDVGGSTDSREGVGAAAIRFLGALAR